MIDNAILERLKRIKMVIFDIDGVMTDGRVIYSVYGDELKFFDVTDGLGIMLLVSAGIKTVIITAKKSRIVKTRARDMKITKVYQGYMNKLVPLKNILFWQRIKPEEICFIGDDLIDIPVLKRVGLAVAVPNAMDEVKKYAHYITSRPGGRGAVREICDMLLKAQGKWDRVTSKFFE